MSFNIRYGTANDVRYRWPRRREFLIDVMREQNADVVGLQEALDFQIDEIVAALPFYGVIGVGRDDGARKGEYSAILFRRDRFQVSDAGTFWFSDTPDVVASKSWGNNITRICTWARLVDPTAARSGTTTCTGSPVATVARAERPVVAAAHRRAPLSQSLRDHRYFTPAREPAVASMIAAAPTWTPSAEASRRKERRHLQRVRPGETGVEKIATLRAGGRRGDQRGHRPHSAQRADTSDHFRSCAHSLP